MKKSGFTLVELSIVLVIIGLLIGGILVGQSLIESAKINKEVRRLSQYSIALEQFKAKFRQEAGDTKLFPNPGNTDGDSEDSLGSCPVEINEYRSAWSHLSQSKMLSENYVWPTPSLNCGAAGFIGVTPTNKISASGFIAAISYFYRNSRYNFGGKAYTRYFGTSYDPEILWGIENKMDDGMPSSSQGKIFSATDDDYECTPDGVKQEVAANGASSRTCDVYIYFNNSLN